MRIASDSADRELARSDLELAQSIRRSSDVRTAARRRPAPGQGTGRRVVRGSGGDGRAVLTRTPGEPGELVVTNLGRWGSPLLRYRTGDIVREDTSSSPDGYELLRLAGGILGRSDDMLTIRGNNFYPSALEEWLRQIPHIAEYRITLREQKSMQHIEVEIEPDAAAQTPDAQASLVQQVTQLFKTRLNFQVQVTAVPPDALPRFEMKGKRFRKASACAE